MRLPPEIICEIIRFIESGSTFCVLRSLSKTVRDFIDSEDPECSVHVPFVVRNLNQEGLRLPYALDVTLKSYRCQMRVYARKVASATTPPYDNHLHFKDFGRIFPNLRRLRVESIGEIPHGDYVPGLSHLLPQLTCLELSAAGGCQHPPFEALAKQVDFSSLTGLSLSGRIFDINSTHLRSFPNLRALEISSSSFGWNIEALSCLKDLRKLSLANSFFSGLPPRAFAIFPRLEILYIAGGGIGLESLVDLPESVRKLHLKRVFGFEKEQVIDMLNLGREEEDDRRQFEEFIFRKQRLRMGIMRPPKNDPIQLFDA